jgi:hypothetical protein
VLLGAGLRGDTLTIERRRKGRLRRLLKLERALSLGIEVAGRDRDEGRVAARGIALMPKNVVIACCSSVLHLATSMRSASAASNPVIERFGFFQLQHQVKTVR